jgi:glycosyltransferase involved in cell wall biosynthesis
MNSPGTSLRQSLQDRPIALVGNTSWYLHNFRAGTIRALGERGARVICIAPKDATSSALADELGAEHIDWPLDLNGHNPVRELGSLVRLIKILKGRRPCFVFNFTIKPNIYSGIACRLLGLPYANNVTGLGMLLGAGGLLSRIAAWLYGLSNRGAARVFVQNPDDLAELRRRGLLGEARPVELAGSGVDLEHFVAAPLQAASPTFVMIARLQADKGVREFVAAARRMRQSCPGARFVLVGPTDTANQSAIPKRELDAWRAEGVVETPGPTDDVRPWLAQSDALVLPSYGGEGMPRVLLEAAACARPAIVSDVPGCRHAVIDGRTGFICEPRSADALAVVLEKFVALPVDTRSKMGRTARALAEERFSERIAIDAYIDCLIDCLEPDVRRSAA